MKKSASTFLLLSVLIINAFSQKSDVVLKEYFLDAEYFFAQEYYNDALNDYIQIFKRGYKENPNLNYKIGLCYLNIQGKKDQSIVYLEKAASGASLKFKESTLKEKYAPIDALLYLGNAYRVNNILDKAVASYKMYMDILPKDKTELHSYAKHQIEACQVAHMFMNDPLNIKFENLGEIINGSTSDYKAVISGDGSTLVFMHRLPFYDAIYISKNVDGKWTRPKNITPQVMSDGDQYVTSISYDGKTLYLTREDEFDSDIYASEFIDNRWTKSVNLGPVVNTKYWESHASISKDGRKLYFASNSKESLGNMDIFVSEKNKNGHWGPPRNLGNVINSELNEDTPFITENGKTLYFSSQANANMGGYDIFFSELINDTAWSKPRNIGYPINTTDDDLFFYPWNQGKLAFVSRIFKEGQGDMDIYKVSIPGNDSMTFAEYATANVDANPLANLNPNILNTQNYEDLFGPDSTESTPEDTTAEAFVAEATTDTSAVIKEKGQEQSLVAQNVVSEQPEIKTGEELEDRPSNESETKPVSDTAGNATEKAMEVPQATTTHKEIENVFITPLFFGFDNFQLTEEAKQELNKVTLLMKKYPQINIVLLGYTDALGSAEYNRDLAEKRAKTALNYLVAKNVENSRVKSVGKGEQNFIAPNTHEDGSDYPEARKLNRRVECELSGYDGEVLIIKKMNPVPEDLQIQKK